MIAERRENVMQTLFERVAAALLAAHRWAIEELRGVQPAKIELGRINVLHYNELACAAEFLLDMEEKVQIHFSIEAETKWKEVEEVKNALKEGCDVVFEFFEENMQYAEAVNLLIAQYPVSQWNAKSRLFIVTETKFQLPPRLIWICRLFALE
jgi:hypothetical protein